MNASINLESLTEMPQHFEQAKCPDKKNNRYLDKLTVYKLHHILAKLQKASKMEDATIQNILFRGTRISVLPKIEI